MLPVCSSLRANTVLRKTPKAIEQLRYKVDDIRNGEEITRVD